MKMFYEVIAKTITNRLKQALDSMILHEQFAIVLGRLISDNALIGLSLFMRLTARLKGGS